MKIVYVGLVVLCALTLAYAATGNRSTDSKAVPSADPNSQVSDQQVATPTASSNGQSAAVMSRAEADSLRVQSDSLVAQSGISDIAVGNIGSDELIYILVVVLLVVLIVSVL